VKALSIRQPWATLIVGGLPILKSVDNGDGSTSVKWSGKVILKDIENRSRPTNFRGRIYVHAPKLEAPFERTFEFLVNLGLAPMVALMSFSKRLGRQVIIGEVDIVGCVTESKSPWFTGPYGWVLANPVVYEHSIPCKGKLGFFEVPMLKDKDEGR